MAMYRFAIRISKYDGNIYNLNNNATLLLKHHLEHVVFTAFARNGRTCIV